jgi:DNA-binding beta-propeller fold protein YncE
MIMGTFYRSTGAPSFSRKVMPGPDLEDSRLLSNTLRRPSPGEGDRRARIYRPLWRAVDSGTITEVAVALLAILGLFGGLFGVLLAPPLRAQESVPSFAVDPSWPKPLPNNWTTGQVGGVCVDSQDHIFIVNRRTLTDKEELSASPAPPIIEFDLAGNVINSFGAPDTVPDSIHGCTTDGEGNVYVAGNHDGIIQKYSPEGKLLLQIGTRGKVDTSDGRLTIQAGGGGFEGRALNSSHDGFFLPASIAIDPADGDIYVADGYGNSRIAVFDKSGRFLRQWGRQGTKAEVEAGMGGVFMQVVHCVAIGNDGLVYVCDRQGDRIEVFDKLGNFKKNILIHTGGPIPDLWGTAWWIGFSPDPQQRYMYVANGRNEAIHILDHASGRILASFGRPGHQVGEFDHAHTLAVDSKGNIYVAETDWGKRVQRFTLVQK